MSIFGWSNWNNWNNAWSNFGQTTTSGTGTYYGYDGDSVSGNEQTAIDISTALTFRDDPLIQGINGFPNYVADNAPVLSYTIQNPVANETLGFDLTRLANNGLTLVGNQIFAGDTLILTLTETVQNGQIVAISAKLPPKTTYSGTFGYVDDHSAVQNAAIAAMSSITYEYLGDNPPAGDRTIDVHWDADNRYNVPNNQDNLITVHVTNVNDGPVLVGTQAQLTHGFEDVAYQIDASDLLTGFSDPENDVLSVSNLTTDHGTITDNGDGTFTLAPEDGFSGDVTLSYHIVDGQGGDIEASLTFTVDAGYFGDTSSNLFDPGTGPQAMFGLSGDDTYVVDDAHDLVVENPDEGTDTVQTALTYTLGANVENLVLTGTGDINGNGNGLDNVITGNSGANTLTGAGGNDRLDGGAGDDHLLGGSGNDTYVVDSSGDVVSEETTPGVDDGGTDTVIASIDYVLGVHIENLALTGTDDLDGTGNALNNVLTGNAGDNLLTGGGGNDWLDGGGGSDDMIGGVGNDTYVVDKAADFVFEKANQGTDTVLSSVSYTLTDNVENLTLTGSNNIKGTGNALANTIIGNSGNNLLDGLLGADILYGGAGNDSYYVDNASDLVSEQRDPGIDDGGSDKVYSSVSFILPQFVEQLYLLGVSDINATGNDGANALYGNSGSNRLTGLGGNDRLDGGGGADVMYGGAGNDSYYVDSASDVVSEQTTPGADDGGTDHVYATASFILPQYVETLSLLGSGDINGTGNDGANALYGNSGSNILTGLGGNDRLDGDAGADIMYGGAGNDSYYVDNSADMVSEQTTPETDDGGSDRIYSSVSYTLPAYVEMIYLTGGGDINATGNDGGNALYGNSGSNVLTGLGGNDRLDGGAGADIMYGGAGNDTYLVDNASDVVSEQTTPGTDDGGSDRVYSSVSFVLPQYVESLYLTGTGGINATGSSGSNRLYGNSGDNVLNGMQGVDYLTGGAGADTFVFTHVGGAFGADRITDFESGTDHLLFTAADFGFSPGHVLDASELSLTGAATGATPQFVYNPTTHILYWDSNGTAAGGLVSVAVFSNGETPQLSDFVFG